MLILSIEPTGLAPRSSQIEDEVSYDIELIHVLENGKEWYDWKTGECIVKVNNWIDNAYKQGGTEAEFISFLMESDMMVLTGEEKQDEASFRDIYDSNKALLDLHRETRGLLRFSYMDEDDDDENPIAVLVPDDPLVYGFFMQYVDGSYRFCLREEVGQLPHALMTQRVGLAGSGL